MSFAPNHSAVLLAAGASRRLGRPKQLLEIDGIPLIRRAALAALASSPRQLLVALGAEVDGCRAALEGLPLDLHIVEDWAAGMGATLASGVRALRQPVAGLLVIGVDQPALDAAHLNAMVGCWRADPARVIASAYAGAVGTPALFPQDWLARLAALRGDLGARQLLREAVEATQIIHAPELAIDIDDAQDFATWQRSRGATR